MNDRPTPETERVKAAYYTNWDDLLNHARKLERERDEAREALRTLAEHGENEIKERDELRNKLADALQEVDLRTLDYERMKKERDEARELAEAYKEYAQLLGDEINSMAAVAHFHGWKSSRVEQGKVLREKIKQMEEAK